MEFVTAIGFSVLASGYKPERRTIAGGLEK
jgi:hypothetical protein